MIDPNEVVVAMPLHLTHELINAVRDSELTRCDSREEWHTRLGWLMCAYDVMVAARITLDRRIHQ